MAGGGHRPLVQVLDGRARSSVSWCTWLRGTRPAAERAGAAKGSPTIRCTLDGRGIAGALGHDRHGPADAHGHDGGSRSGQPGRRHLRGARPRSPPSSAPPRGTDQDLTGLEHVLGPAQGLPIGGPPVHGKGADGQEEAAEARPFPQAVLGHVVELAPGHLGHHEEIDERPVDGGDDHRAVRRHQALPLNRGAEQQTVEHPDQETEDPVDGREPGVDAHLPRGEVAPTVARPRAVFTAIPGPPSPHRPPGDRWCRPHGHRRPPPRGTPLGCCPGGPVGPLRRLPPPTGGGPVPRGWR